MLHIRITLDEHTPGRLTRTTILFCPEDNPAKDVEERAGIAIMEHLNKLACDAIGPVSSETEITFDEGMMIDDPDPML